MKTMIIMSALVALAGCTPRERQLATSAALDVSGAICSELAQQPEPGRVTFACALVVGGSAQTFKARVEREDAPTFAARHCPASKPGTVAP